MKIKNFEDWLVEEFATLGMSPGGNVAGMGDVTPPSSSAIGSGDSWPPLILKGKKRQVRKRRKKKASSSLEAQKGEGT